jgi:hypothetical protein
MKRVKLFEAWLAESAWAEENFKSQGEKEVADVAEQELLSKELMIVEEEDDLFGKLSQIASTEKGEKVLEITGHDLTKFSSPMEFIKWEKLGGDSEVISSCFIVKTVDKNKI